MKIEDMKKLSEMIAQRTADIVMERISSGSSFAKENDDEYVSSEEAANILGVTPSYLRSMKNKFPHKKVGNHSQGRIFFLKSGLLENYIK